MLQQIVFVIFQGHEGRGCRDIPATVRTCSVGLLFPGVGKVGIGQVSHEHRGTSAYILWSTGTRLVMDQIALHSHVVKPRQARSLALFFGCIPFRSWHRRWKLVFKKVAIELDLEERGWGYFFMFESGQRSDQMSNMSTSSNEDET